MPQRRDHKIYAGVLLLILLIIMNLYRAANYYDLKKAPLSAFFIWQTNLDYR